MKQAIFLFFIFSVLAVDAQADSVLCTDSSGNITARSKCKIKNGERRLNLSGITAQGAVGPQGPKGDSGTGGIDIANCFKRESISSGSGVVSAQATCLVSEVLVTSGCPVSGSAVIAGHSLFTSNNSVLGAEVYTGVYCVAYDPYNVGSTYSIKAQAWCCRPNS